MLYPEKHYEVIPFRSRTLVSENKLKITFIRPPVTKKRPFKKLKILSFLAPFIWKMKTINIFNFSSVKYFDKVLLFLKNCLIRVNYCWNYRPSNLLFRFLPYRLDHFNNKESKLAENLTIHFFWKLTPKQVWWNFQFLWPTHHKMTVL